MCTIGRTSVGTARKAHHRPDRTECTTRCEQDRTDYGSKRGHNSFLNTALAPIAQKSIVVDSYGSNGINVITQENYEFLRDSFFNYALLLKQEAVHTPGKSIGASIANLYDEMDKLVGEGMNVNIEQDNGRLYFNLWKCHKWGELTLYYFPMKFVEALNPTLRRISITFIHNLMRANGISTNEKINSEASAVPQDRLPLPQRVLVIDNDTLQLEIAKEMLERNGVSCTTCSNAKELVNEMRRQDYDLLLSDIQMPETNGFEILALLRKSSIGNSHTIPIVAMTARGEGEKEAFIKGGFTDSIHKPFSMRELLDMVSSVVSRDVEESHTPDFATFTADVLDKRELLRTFIIQSEQNMADLQSAIKTGDIEKLHDIAHEIKPSLELLRADAPLVKLRTTLNDSACDMNTVNEQVKLLIGHISGLITEAEKEIKKMSDETEGTDS